MDNNILRGMGLVGIVCLGGMGFHYGFRGFQAQLDNNVQIERIRAGLEVNTGYYNDNNDLDSFYTIDGNDVPLVVDGRPIKDYFRE